METLTIHTAKKTMHLKDSNACVSFVSTIWRDKPVLIMFNNLTNKIIEIYFNPVCQDGDEELLESLVISFLM